MIRVVGRVVTEALYQAHRFSLTVPRALAGGVGARPFIHGAPSPRSGRFYFRISSGSLPMFAAMRLTRASRGDMTNIRLEISSPRLVGGVPPEGNTMAHFWEKSYPQSVSWDTRLPPAVPLENLLETAAGEWPKRTAIDFYDRTFSFSELNDLAARAAKGQTLGVGPGVHVGLHLPNTPHFVISFFAVLLATTRLEFIVTVSADAQDGIVGYLSRAKR